MIAGIIYNRLQQGMKLESDTTVLYANHVEGKLTTNDEQRAKDSPYNTYLYNGLPPTPIDNPGATSMEAAVTPIKSDYLYWVVTDPDKALRRIPRRWPSTRKMSRNSKLGVRTQGEVLGQYVLI